MFGVPFIFIENSRIHGIIYRREKSMQLYETIDIPQSSNSVIRRKKIDKSSSTYKKIIIDKFTDL